MLSQVVCTGRVHCVSMTYHSPKWSGNMLKARMAAMAHARRLLLDHTRAAEGGSLMNDFDRVLMLDTDLAGDTAIPWDSEMLMVTLGRDFSYDMVISPDIFWAPWPLWA